MGTAKSLPKVFIVVLNYKGWRDTVACLDSNYCGSYAQFEAVVVDNGSCDESLREIKTWAVRNGVRIKGEITLQGGRPKNFPLSPFQARALTLIETEKNLGFSAGNNRGIEYALANRADFIFLLNNDTVAESETLRRLVDSLESNAKIGALFPLILDSNGEIQVPVYLRAAENFRELLLASNLPGVFWARYRYRAYLERRNPFVDYGYDRLITVPNIVVACTLYRREFFERVGLFDENVFMYLEEDIMLHRLRRTDLTVALEPRARLIHKGGADNAKLPPAFLYMKRICGEMYYVRTYMRLKKPCQLMLKFLRVFQYIYGMADSPDYRKYFPEFLRLYILERASSAQERKSVPSIEEDSARLAENVPAQISPPKLPFC